ncbi:MAG: hypothetical protein K2L87_03365, partial [Clostridiales bacterium]|nr:hypothetical protein [Clostridiales bacterium]
ETSAPCALIADVYGQLFVVHSDGSVFFYTEETFLDEGTIIGERADFTLPTGPSGFTSPRADFDGNIYCLSGSGIYKNGALFAVIKGDENVFSASRTTPVAFALGFEDNTVYLNYGDFIVKTNALTFPTLDTIRTENAAERIFTSQESVTLVSVHEGAIGIRTDLDLLKADESDYFPYSHYFRTAQAQRGILLTTTEKYSVVALFGKDHKYTANLFLTEGYLTEVPREEYWVDGSGSAYLSSDVSLSLFPCLVPALRGERLNRMDKIALMGIVSAGETSDYEYALVRCQSGAAEIEGFVPLSYLTHAAPISEAQNYRLAYLKENKEGTLFFSDLGQPITLCERTQIEISDLEEGTYLAHYRADGVDYYATVTDDVLEAPQSNALRISLIVILTVVGVVIIGDYFFLRPLRQKKKNL